MKALGVFLLLLATAGWAGDYPASHKDTADLLASLIRINTSNPPGQEGKMAEYLATLFRPLGFEVDIFPTPEAGKAHFVARLRGDGSKKPVLLAAHADVVGVEREKWSVDPFAGVIKDGYVYGRGAIDFKGGLAVFAQAVMMLAKNKVALARDVIFLSEADEEGGKYSTRWLAQSHWDKMDCEFSLNEGGWILKNDDGSVRYVSISTADKSGVSLVLTAKGTSTHASMPRPDNAIFTLSKAMAKIADYDTKPLLTPSTRQFFLTLAETSKPPMAKYFYNLVNSTDPREIDAADKEISKDTLLHAIMRNTIAPVLMSAGFRGNVIPGSAEATINFRTIPGTDPQDLVKEIRNVIGDPNVEITVAKFPGMTDKEMAAYRSSKPSSEDSDLYRALVQAAKAEFPGAPVTPYLFQAGTDAYPWRARGIPVYGIYPYPISMEDLKRMHGNDERVSVESLRQGTEMIYQTLVKVAGK
jgi:acetylornithine deacetylase/succinyl-diaminopimelate desuccinylase-like protein